MVDNEYNTDIYISVKIIIGTVMKNSEILKFVPDHLKTKKKFKNVVKNYHLQENMFLIDIQLNKCVTKLF